MDKKTVFVKTEMGDKEVDGQSDVLFGDNKRILSLVDDESTVSEIAKRAPPSLRDSVNEVLQQLVDGGFIKDLRAPAAASEKSALKMSTPSIKMAAPRSVLTPPLAAVKSETSSNIQQQTVTSKNEKKSDLDFSFIMSAPAQSQPVTQNQQTPNRSNLQDGAIAKSGQEAAQLQAMQAVQREAIQKAAKLKAYEEAKIKAQIEVAARAKQEAEARAKKEAEIVRMKAEQEALRVRTEAAAAKARADAEVRIRFEAEARIKQEAEDMRRQAELEAERRRKELEVARLKAESEMRLRIEAEVRAKAELESKMKREAEALRLRLEKEQAELDTARIKVEAEIRIREEAELRARLELESRLRADALAKLEAESRLAQDLFRESANKPGSGKELGDTTDKLRQSFLDSFNQQKKKQDSNTGSFKLEKFSLDATGKIAVYSGETRKPDLLPGAGSKVKNAMAERAMREENAARSKAGQEAALLKSGQEEANKVRMQQEAAAAQAAQAQAEQESMRLKAEHEAYRLKVEQEEARAKVEAESQELSDYQIKQWKEAQRRAASLQEKEKILAKQIAEAETKSWQKSVRKIRKPLPIGKLFAGLIVMAVLAVAGLPYFWPTEEYISPIETEISERIKQPIKIKKIHFSILPMPKIELLSVVIGKAEELKIANMIVNFDISALFASTRSISKLELRNVTMSGIMLEKNLALLESAGGIEKYPVARMEFKGLQVYSDEIKLPLLHGLADFDSQGKFTRADLKSEDGKLSFELQLQQRSLKLDFNLRESSLPLFPTIKFNDLSATALISNGEAVISDIFSHVYGGSLTGKGRLSWGNGWRMQGQIEAKSLDLQRMFPGNAVTGDVRGEVNLSMSGAVLSKLDADPRLEGSFEIGNGKINKIDIVTAARFGMRPGVVGLTNFSEMTGTLKADRSGQRIFINKLTSTTANTTGVIDVGAKQQLSGKLQVEIKGSENGTFPLQLSGSILEPLVR